MDTKNLNYSNYCKVCKYMKRHKAFTQDLLESRYFEPNAPKTLPDVMRTHGLDYPMQTMYACLKKHHGNLRNRPALKINKDGQLVIDNRLEGTLSVVEGVQTTNHELGLDDFISQGRELLAQKKIPITATTYLQAIKIKADIEKGSKDRKLDILKTMFSGAAPKHNDE